jgi:hypothetical protein
MADLSDEELLADLGISVEPKKLGGRTAREERLIAGFEEIQRFVTEKGHAPRHGESLDIFERLYAVRLDRLRTLPDARQLLLEFDTQGLLTGSSDHQVADAEQLDDEALLEELGVGNVPDNDITQLRHVTSREERRAAEEIANRTRCEDFSQFKPLFEKVDKDIKEGLRQTRPYIKEASIETGNFFILGGQIAYVASTGETIKAPNGESDARLRVIYSNGTESNLLRRSLQRALYKDGAGRRITEPSPGPLFSENWEEGDESSGTIYVLRSKSTHPFVSKHRELVHKIGVTRGKVETRIANAALEATYLLADVEIVATYKLAEINGTKLETLFHRIFSAARLDLTIHDRFGNPVRPQEWFLLPLHVIDEAVQRVIDGTIADLEYDPKSARLAKRLA